MPYEGKPMVEKPFIRPYVWGMILRFAKVKEVKYHLKEHTPQFVLMTNTTEKHITQLKHYKYILYI